MIDLQVPGTMAGGLGLFLLGTARMADGPGLPAGADARLALTVESGCGSRPHRLLGETKPSTSGSPWLDRAQAPILGCGAVSQLAPSRRAMPRRGRERDFVHKPLLSIDRSAGAPRGRNRRLCRPEQGCDATVMGTRAPGTMAGRLLGSVATKVVQLAQLPITRVKSAP